MHYAFYIIYYFISVLSCQNLSLINKNEQHIFTKCGFTIMPGSLIIVQGPNGSGKTCFLKMIAGLIRNKYSKIKWNDIDIWSDINVFRSNISYIAHNNALKLSFSVKENLQFWCDLRGKSELLEPAIAYFQLDNFLDIEVKNLSSGWRRKVELAKLIINGSNLWLMDEPEANLDEESKKRLLNLVRIKSQEGGVVIIASHEFRNVSFANYINLTDFKNEKMAFDTE